jgi:hypothetical protein
MYKVLAYFTDLQDNNHPYNEGDIFPRRDGFTVSEARLEELSSTRNRRGIRLIEFVEEQELPKPLTKTEINRMPIAELKDLALKNGIKNAEDMTGAELKKVLISRFEL